jgi:hypothetical protein
MIEAYRSVLGSPPPSFAAPAWRVTPLLLELESEAKLDWAADARGTHPFLPRFQGQDYPVPQLPVTLPTLDECQGRQTPEEFVSDILRQMESQAEYCCFTAHAESEGRAHQGVLEAILGRSGRGARPLGEAPREHLPRIEMAMGRLPGRPYDVCLQGS